jgi:hypothetical protein
MFPAATWDTDQLHSIAHHIFVAGWLIGAVEANEKEFDNETTDQLNQIALGLELADQAEDEHCGYGELPEDPHDVEDLDYNPFDDFIDDLEINI